MTVRPVTLVSRIALSSFVLAAAIHTAPAQAIWRAGRGASQTSRNAGAPRASLLRRDHVAPNAQHVVPANETHHIGLNQGQVLVHPGGRAIVAVNQGHVAVAESGHVAVQTNQGHVAVQEGGHAGVELNQGHVSGPAHVQTNMGTHGPSVGRTQSAPVDPPAQGPHTRTGTVFNIGVTHATTVVNVPGDQVIYHR